MLISLNPDEFDQNLDIEKIQFPREIRDFKTDFMNVMNQYRKTVNPNPPLMTWAEAPSGFHYRTNYTPKFGFHQKWMRGDSDQ